MKRNILLLLLLLQVVTLSAQNNTAQLSLKEAEQLFMNNNMELIAERYNISKAEASVAQAKLFDNPTVSFEMNAYNRLNKRYLDVGPQSEYAVDVEQLINLAGQRNKRVKLEILNKEIAVEQFGEVLRTLRSELKSKFVELYFTNKSINIYDSELAHLEHLLSAMKQQESKGNVSLLEKSRIEALILSLKQEKNEKSNNIIELQGELKLLLHLKPEVTMIPVFDENALTKFSLAAVSYSDLSAKLLDRPDLKIAESNLRASQANLNLQKAMAAPDFSLKGSYDKAGGFVKNYFAIGFNVSIPIFNRNQGNIKSAKMDIFQSNSLRDIAKEKAASELQTAYAKLEKSVELYQSSNYQLEKDFEKIISGVNANFEKRNISMLEFLDYYQAYKETCLQLYDTEENVVLNIENLNSVVGQNVINY